MAQNGQILAERFQQLDANNDGQIVSEELPHPKLFQRLDLNRDGAVTMEEAQEAFRAGVLDGIDLKPSVPGLKLAPKADPEVSANAVTSVAQDEIRKGPKYLPPGDHGVGTMVPDVTIRDLSGDEWRLGDLIKQHGRRSQQAKAVVIAMTSTSCPLSRKYLPTLTTLSDMYSSEGVQFVLVNPVAVDKPADMQSARQLLNAGSIYMFDEDETLATAVGATTTTDVIVLDSSRTILFHGAIDDQYGFGYSRDNPQHNYLADALDAIIAGRQPLIAATDAPGCSLDLEPPTEASASLTYHNRIARLMQRHCVECHREGGVGPFALDSYADVVAHAPMIREVITRGIMPPWFAVPGDESVHSPWINDRSLTMQEKTDLTTWLNSDQPEGNIADTPAPLSFPDGWLIGKPDQIFQFAQPVPVKATGTMPYKNVEVETLLEEDKWVQAIEIQPGDRSVVHHVLVFIKGSDSSERRRGNNAADDERSGYWGIYVPGNSTLIYPDGFAKLLPRGATLRFQMHYTPNGTATEDTTRIGVVFAKEPPKHEVKVASIVNARLRIPPGADNHREVAQIRIPSDVQVLAFLPHMHLRGKAARYDVTAADGKQQTLLDIPRYDFNWQLLYRYADPITLRKGDSLQFTAWYDNSANNPANPDPNKEVRWGPQTFDEMHLGYVEYIVPGETPGKSNETALRQNFRDALSNNLTPGNGSFAQLTFKRLDVNQDGSLTMDEIRSRLPERTQAAQLIFQRLDSDNDQQLSHLEFEQLNKVIQTLQHLKSPN